MTAEEMHKYFSVFPTLPDKSPLVKSWAVYRENKISVSVIKKATHIGIVCGFDNLEIIDIDNHLLDADDNFQFIYDNFDLTEFPIVKTQGGGYHIYLKSEGIEGSQKLANKIFIADNKDAKLPDGSKQKLVKNSDGKWQKKICLVETRGVGGYVVAPPTPGYKLISGDFSKIPNLSKERRDELISVCKALNETPVIEKEVGVSGEDGRPGDVYNEDVASISETKALLKADGWTTTDDKHWIRPGKKKGVSATFQKVGKNKFYVFSTNAHPFEDNTSYSMFAVRAIINHNGDFKACAKELAEKYDIKPKKQPPKKRSYSDENGDELDYVRVGTVFLKKTINYDRNGNPVKTLSKWNRQSLLDDFGKDFLKMIRKYDSFCNIPSHTDYKQVYGNSFNLYNDIEAKPTKGEWKTIGGFLKHIFGEQYEMGLDYLQLLFKDPLQQLPMLALVSFENNTGKTTFANFLQYIFKDNAVSIGENELKSEFNGSYATKLIACLDESDFKGKNYINKIIAMGTEENVLLRRMQTEHVKVPFFCKFVFFSNDEDDFITIREEETRFWIRKLKPFSNFDPNYKSKLRAEIPAFINFLLTREYSTKCESRFWFSFSSMQNEYLTRLKVNSISKESQLVLEGILNYMEREESQIIKATPRDLKEKVFCDNHKIDDLNIRQVLKKVLKLKCEKTVVRYKFDENCSIKPGRPYIIDIKCLYDKLNL